MIEDGLQGGEVELDDLVAAGRRIVDIARSSPFARRSAGGEGAEEGEGAGRAANGRRRTDEADVPVVLASVDRHEGHRADVVTKALAIDASA